MSDQYQINQMKLISAISDEVIRQHPNMTFDPAIYNACIKAANVVVDECKREKLMTKQGMTVAQWFNCDDTGLSSKYMAYVLDNGATRLPVPAFEIPHDADDLERCIRMVKACGFRHADIDRMYSKSKVWRCISENWHELVKHYDKGDHEYISRFLELAGGDA